jgi:dihydrofolate reductase
MAVQGQTRKVVLQIGMSVDGFVASLPDAQGGSRPILSPGEDPELTERKLAWVQAAGTHIMGRVTYQEMASHWPSSTHAYAAPMNEIPKVVFSTSLQRADWPDSRIARGDVAEEIARLKAEPGGDIIAYGGASFARALVSLDQVDEYRLTIHAVAVGDGLPLFTGLTAPRSLRLIEAQAFACGTVIHVYRPEDRAA